MSNEDIALFSAEIGMQDRDCTYNSITESDFACLVEDVTVGAVPVSSTMCNDAIDY